MRTPKPPEGFNLRPNFGLLARIAGLASWVFLALLPSALTLIAFGEYDAARLVALAEAAVFSLPAAGFALTIAHRVQRRVLRRRNRRRYRNGDLNATGDKYRERDRRRGGLVD